MKHRQHTLQSIIIEVVIVLLASIISFPLSDIVGVSLSALPLVIVVCYVILKSIYHLCISLSAYTIELTSSFYPKQQNKDECTLEGISSRAGDNEIMTKRMELFHYEFQHEQQQYRQQKKKEDDEKLDAIMKYTLTTFKRLNFGETEIFQICECVRYFVTNISSYHHGNTYQETNFRYANLTKKLCMEYCLPIQYLWRCYSKIRLAYIQ